MVSPQSLGGKIAGKILRDAAISGYYRNPNKCLYCKNTINVRKTEKVSFIRRKKFCGHSCAALFNNSKKVKVEKTSVCKNCGVIIKLKYSKKHYLKRKYCDSCFSLISKGNIDSRTKGDLFSNCSNWRSAGASIRSHARKTYWRKGKPFCCHICGYSKHVEVCHIKSVASFSDDSLISEINFIDNLTALCPNHHWEQEQGLLQI